jgi:hypothetical protein
MFFKEIIAVYSESHMKNINILWPNAELLNVIAGGTYNYLWALKDLIQQEYRNSGNHLSHPSSG